MALRHAASRATGAVERLCFVTTIRASPLRQARRGACPRRVHSRGRLVVDRPTLPCQSDWPALLSCAANRRWPGAPVPVARSPELVATSSGTGGRVVGIGGHVLRNRWPRHTGTAGWVTPER